MPLTSVQRDYRAAVLEKLACGVYQLEAVDACPCGAEGTIAIADRDRFGIPIGVLVCSRCGLARTSPRLATGNLAEFYEHDYHRLHGLPEPKPDSVLFRAGQGAAVHTFLAEDLPSGGLRVAEIGAGSGSVLREFAAAAVGRSVAIAGCEYASAFVAAGREAGSDIRQGGPETLAGDGPFDVVILSHVVEHLPDPVRDLAVIRELGYERTLFYVEVPGLIRIDQKPGYAYQLRQYLTLAHTFHFTLTTLTDTMARAGFERVRGDEDIHATFRLGPMTEPGPRPDEVSGILASLARLNSWRLRFRRLPRLARQRARVIAMSVLPGGVYARLRQAAKR
jgi:SAM-dependent methyltransferase